MNDKLEVFAKFALPISAQAASLEFGNVTVRATGNMKAGGMVYIETGGDVVGLTLAEFKALLAHGDYLL